MKITVIGTGYVGLITGACLSSFGHEVFCVDTNKQKIEMLQKGEVPFKEPYLTELVHEGIKEGLLSFHFEYYPVMESDAVFITVGTPTGKIDPVDLEALYSAGRCIAPMLRDYTLIINRSTVPPGTTEVLATQIKERHKQTKSIVNRSEPVFDIISNPEFLREGNAVHDFLRPNKIVIGGATQQAKKTLRQIYLPQFIAQIPIFFTDYKTAELIKYANNAFLAMKVTFANEITNLCRSLNANSNTLIKAIGVDTRIGPDYIKPGPGYGGSCFPKDVRALAVYARTLKAPMLLVEATNESNAQRRSYLLQYISSVLGGYTNLRDKVIGALGVTFKAKTDDIRESPALKILSDLYDAGAMIRLYDPAGMENTQNLYPEFTYHNSPYVACEKADIVLILTEWDEFGKLNLSALAHRVRNHIIMDFRGAINQIAAEDSGFKYYGL